MMLESSASVVLEDLVFYNQEKDINICYVFILLLQTKSIECELTGNSK